MEVLKQESSHNKEFN